MQDITEVINEEDQIRQEEEEKVEGKKKGRPLKIKKCNKKVSTYISEEDYDILIEEAEELEIALSQLVKKIVLKHTR